MLQLSVTALFYLENSGKIHLRGMRACQSKDAKRMAQRTGERERALWLLFLYVFFLSSGSALCKLRLVRSAVSDSLRPHEPQHARPPCPSPTLGVHSDSHPSSPWCHPAISSSVVPNPSQHQSLFQWTLLMRWPKYWSFSFSIIPSKEIPGLISFRMDWLDLPAVRGTF